MKYKIPLSAFYLSLTCGCATFSMSMVHTDGLASDLIDENQTQSPSTSVETQGFFQ